MLEPDVLDYILNSLSVHKQLQESIIRDIVRRIVKGGLSPADSLTETAAYQAEILQKAGIVYDDIVKLVAESSDALYYDIKTAFDSAEVEIFNFDDEVLLSNGYEPETVKTLSPEMKQMWEASLSKTFTEAENLTKTIALTSQNAYISACDLAHMQVASGSFTYSQAIANAAKQASIQGTKVLYASGAVANLDYAVRRSVLTGVNQTAANLMFSKAQELEHDLMQTTAHYGARPEHSLWQGGVVSLSGRAGYHSLDYVGYGTVTGIFGANCKHNWYMYFGFSPYTKEMLEDMRNKTVTYNGQEIPMYDALQKQRGLERHVKTTKRQLVGLDEALKNTPVKDYLALKTEFQAGAVKLKRQEARIADFCKQTGLKRDRFREQVFSAETENGIKSWTKSVSQKAVMANRNALANAAKKDIMYTSKKIEVADVRYIGKIDRKILNSEFGNLKTDEVVLTDERKLHIQERHPNDFALFDKNCRSILTSPDLVLKDVKHENTAFIIKHVEQTNINVILKLSVLDDKKHPKNSIMSAYRIRDKNVKKLEKTHKTLYKKE